MTYRHGRAPARTQATLRAAMAALCIAVAMVVVLCTGAPARAAQDAPPPVALAGGFSEVVVTTADLAAWIEVLETVGGWEQRAHAPLDPALARLWQLPADAEGETVLMANRGAETGFIRLVSLRGLAQAHIRIDDRPWDTGGIFDFNMRVRDLMGLRAKLHARGWVGDSEPIRYVFGPFEVIEWIARGPDGVRIAFIERIAPELDGWPNLVAMSRVFNATAIVRDLDVTRAFFESVLGMKPYLLSNKPSDEAGPNVLGLPHNVATMIARDVAILHPDGKNDGSVEFVEFVGARGSDLSARATPGNLGIATYRFPVVDLDTALARLGAHGVASADDPVTTALAPYGRVRIAGFTTPDAIRIELYEVLPQ